MDASQISPRTITTHHVLKVMALVAMTIDHIGAYLYPELLWLRVIGRITLPILAFLIGHAPNHSFGRGLWLWAALLMLLNPFLGAGFLPVNALITLGCCQQALLMIDRKQLLDKEPWTLIVASVCLFVPSFFIMEYGTLAFLYMLMGYAVRERKMDWRRGKPVMVLALVGFLVIQGQTLKYDMAQMAGMSVLMGALTFYLSRFEFKPVGAIPSIFAKPMLFWSRHSMQYYVIHRLILQAIGTVTGVLNTTLRLI